jgi:hypothetical protein
VLAGADGRGGVHACVGPMSSPHAGRGGLSSDPVRCNCISLHYRKTGHIPRFVYISRYQGI